MKDKFIIPANFMESGYVLNGAVSVRNAVEACVLVLLGYFICTLLPLPEGLDAITYYILIMGPLGLIGLYGIQGDPISVFILEMFKWYRRRNPCFYNAHGEAYTQEAAEYLMDTPQLRDMVADVIDDLRKKMASEETVYVEGETFRFATDPEREALRQAQEELKTKREEEFAKLLEQLQVVEPKKEEQEDQKEQPSANPDGTQDVNAEKIAENIVLEDLEWEEDDDNGEEA